MQSVPIVQPADARQGHDTGLNGLLSHLNYNIDKTLPYLV
jgi:hypothetical protein